MKNRPLIYFQGEYWPDTKRAIPDNAELSVHFIHPKWADLCYFNEKKNSFIYLSTLPREKFVDLEKALG